MNSAPTAGNSNSSSKKRRVTTTTNSAVTNVINATDAAANSGVQQPPQKSIGMEVNDIDAEDQSRDGTGINQQMNNLVEGQCLNLPFEAKADGTVKHKQRKAFFDRVDELIFFKEKHGHLKFHKKEDKSLYDFCHHLRQSRRALLTGKGKINNRLDETRIAALDAIGFNWNPNLPSTLPCSVMCTLQATIPKINIGDVGYQFRKEFDSGWFNGKVVEILPHALSGWDRRCVYEDGDCEDLMFDELKRLATLSPQKHENV